MGIIHGLDAATDTLAEVIKMKPKIDIELKVTEAQSLLCEMLAILQDCERCKRNPDKLIAKLFWESRKPIPPDLKFGRPPTQKE